MWYLEYQAKQLSLNIKGVAILKLSLIKLPALYSIFFIFYRALELIGALVMNLKAFSLPAVGATLMQWESYLWYIAAFGIILHLISVARSLNDNNRIAYGNTLGICAFIADILIPNYSIFALIGHVFATRLILTGANNTIEPVTEGSGRHAL